MERLESPNDGTDIRADTIMTAFCPQARTKLTAIKALFNDFSLSLPQSIASKDLSSVRVLKTKLESSIKELKLLRYQEQLTSWSTFYQEVFKLDIDLSNLHIPEHRDGFDRLIIMAPNLTPLAVYKKMQELFTASSSYTDSGISQITLDSTRPQGTYALWVKDSIEPDQDLLNKSANDIKNMEIDVESFEERCIHEIKYFKETNKHLDINGWTICAASRFAYGGVPRVYWFDVKVSVDSFSPDNSNDNGGVRAAVL